MWFFNTPAVVVVIALHRVAACISLFHPPLLIHPRTNAPSHPHGTRRFLTMARADINCACLFGGAKRQHHPCIFTIHAVPCAEAGRRHTDWSQPPAPSMAEWRYIGPRVNPHASGLRYVTSAYQCADDCSGPARVTVLVSALLVIIMMCVFPFPFCPLPRPHANRRMMMQLFQYSL